MDFFWEFLRESFRESLWNSLRQGFLNKNLRKELHTHRQVESRSYGVPKNTSKLRAGIAHSDFAAESRGLVNLPPLLVLRDLAMWKLGPKCLQPYMIGLLRATAGEHN